MNGVSNLPLVSVIMNCYNSEKFLADAIESVLNQTYENFELIFWDNQSTDNSSDIIKSYDDDRIKYYFASEFTPLGVARNLAASMAKGEWIAFLDSDDLWSKSKLKRCFELLDKSSCQDSISLVFTAANIIDSSGGIIGEYSRHDSGNINRTLLVDGNFIVQSAIMVRMSVFRDINGVDSALGFCPDYDLLLKVTRRGVALGIGEKLASYRIHDGSMTLTKEYSNYSELIDYLSKWFSGNPQDILTKILIWKRQVYLVTALTLKMILKFEVKKVLFLLEKYWQFLIFSPFGVFQIIWNKAFKRIGN